MTQRSICLVALTVAVAVTVALGACKKKAPEGQTESPPYPAPNDAAAEPAPTPSGSAAEPAAGSAAAAEPAGSAAQPADTAKPGDQPADTAKPGDVKPGDAKGDKPGDTAAKPGDAKPGDTATKPGDKAGGDRKCGGIAGFRCKPSEKCRYAASAFAPRHPDDMGACVAETYCDAVADCANLIHPMVLGKWACEHNGCAWKAEAGAPQ